MDEAQRIFDYLPVSFHNAAEQEYVDFLWDAFETNYNSGKYPFAFLAFHMLFMCFVYFEIWQIRENCREDFEKAMVGFSKDPEKELLAAKTPFALVQINESAVFRFLKLIGLNNSDIGRFTKIVKDRNEAAHSNGNIFYKSKESLDDKIGEMMSCIETIQVKSAVVIEKAYRSFLLDSKNPDEREFLDDESQVREIFVHGNYLSVEDVKVAKQWDVAGLSTDVDYSNIKSLADALAKVDAE